MLIYLFTEEKNKAKMLQTWIIDEPDDGDDDDDDDVLAQKIVGPDISWKDFSSHANERNPVNYQNTCREIEEYHFLRGICGILAHFTRS